MIGHLYVQLVSTAHGVYAEVWESLRGETVHTTKVYETDNEAEQAANNWIDAYHR